MTVDASGGGSVTVTGTVVDAVESAVMTIIVVEPLLTPVIAPDASTTATVVSALSNSNSRSSIGLPLESKIVTDRVSIGLPSPSAIDSSPTVTDTAICSTVTTTESTKPSLVAVSVAVPGATAVATPLSAMVMTDVSDEDQSIDDPGINTPFESETLALRSIDSPSASRFEGAEARFT